VRPVKTKPGFRCDFCHFVATELTVKKHEPRCWNNPNRHCEYCNDKGYDVVVHGDLIEEGDCGLSENVPCPYCSQLDQEKAGYQPEGIV
jgi:hypothetical protein